MITYLFITYFISYIDPFSCQKKDNKNFNKQRFEIKADADIDCGLGYLQLKQQYNIISMLSTIML